MANTKQIHDFCKKLTYIIQSLKELNEVDGAIALALDKLPAIRGDLVCTDINWEKCNFVQFSEALRLWTRQNPADTLNTGDKTWSQQNAGQIYNTAETTLNHTLVYTAIHTTINQQFVQKSKHR